MINIILGVILWQLICTIVFFIKKQDEQFTGCFSLGIFFIICALFCLMIRWILTIYYHSIYSIITIHTEFYYGNNIKKYKKPYLIKKFNLKKYKLGEEYKQTYFKENGNIERIIYLEKTKFIGTTIVGMKFDMDNIMERKHIKDFIK